MTAKLTARRVTHADRQQASADKLDKLVKRIRAGKIHSIDEAMEYLGVSRAWVSVLVKRARASGIRIATGTGAHWEILP